MEILQVAIDKIRPSDQGKGRLVQLESLTESIRAVGIRNAIEIRPLGTNQYEIVTGHRRYAAAKLAGLRELPAVIVTVDDSQAQTLRITENMHRLQLAPMEEAAAIEKLLKLGRTNEEAAADLGMTAVAVARRAKLIDLSPSWKKALQTGKVKNDMGYEEPYNVQQWPVACLEFVARYPHERQDQILENFVQNFDFPSLDELKRIEARDNLSLGSAPWKLDDESLNPKAGACAACPKRTGAQPLLFSDDAAGKIDKKKDACLDRNCWDEKLKRHTEQRLEKVRAEHPDAIAVSSETDYTSDRGKTGLAKQDYTECSKTTPGAKRAVLVDGLSAGRTLYIKPNAGTNQSNAKTVAGEKLQKKKPITDKDRAQRLRDRRHKWIVDQVRERLSRSGKDAPVPSLKTIAAAVVTFGLTLHGQYEKIETRCRKLAAALAVEDQVLGERFWSDFRKDMSRALVSVDTGIYASQVVPTMTPVFRMMGVTFEELWKESAKEIPDRQNYLGENSQPVATAKPTAKAKSAKKGKRAKK